jgi:hypothetical protein
VGERERKKREEAGGQRAREGGGRERKRDACGGGRPRGPQSSTVDQTVTVICEDVIAHPIRAKTYRTITVFSRHGKSDGAIFLLAFGFVWHSFFTKISSRCTK